MDALTTLSIIELLLLVFLAATLYSSVGHGGASGYLAALALFGLAPGIMKPAALTMNVFVSTLVLIRLVRAGYFNWKLFRPFAAGSIPLAYVGGAYSLDEASYKYIVGAALLIAAIRLLQSAEDRPASKTPDHFVSLPVGAALGRHAYQCRYRRGVHSGQFRCRTVGFCFLRRALAGRTALAGPGCIGGAPLSARS